MNLDERIDSLLDLKWLRPDDKQARRDDAKQLIREVVEYVKPEYDPTHLDADTVKACLAEMEAKIAELGI